MQVVAFAALSAPFGCIASTEVHLFSAFSFWSGRIRAAGPINPLNSIYFFFGMAIAATRVCVSAHSDPLTLWKETTHEDD